MLREIQIEVAADEDWEEEAFIEVVGIMKDMWNKNWEVIRDPERRRRFFDSMKDDDPDIFLDEDTPSKKRSKPH